MEKSTWIGIVVVLLVLAALGYAFFEQPEDNEPVIETSSFEECVAASYPVMESYPRQCRTPDGRTLVETIAEPANDLIAVSAPQPDAVISSPYIVRGEARGPWYFEATFPIELQDESGNRIAMSYAQAQGEWMTEDFVPFEGKLIWAATSTTAASGTLIFHKDNPSGLPENDASVEIKVRLAK